MKYAFILENKGRFGTETMCRVLEVSQSGYYAWLKRSKSIRQRQDESLEKKIQRIFINFKSRYGSPRIARELRAMGQRVGEKRVARLMRKLGLCAKGKRKFRVCTTDSKHDLPVSPNLLNQHFVTERPNKAWVSDITYIATGEGWLYLCVILDLFSRRVVGWSMASHMEASLVCAALGMAVKARRPGPNLIFHSDRGVQYASRLFRRQLRKYRMVQSMSRKGNCYDNACCESFFHSLKVEEVHEGRYQTREEARSRIFEYIEVFYNRIRLHSSNHYLSPSKVEGALVA